MQEAKAHAKRQIENEIMTKQDFGNVFCTHTHTPTRTCTRTRIAEAQQPGHLERNNRPHAPLVLAPSAMLQPSFATPPATRGIPSPSTLHAVVSCEALAKQQ